MLEFIVVPAMPQQGIVQHTGYHSCERCLVRGVSIHNRIVFDKEGPSVKREDETF